ncbi:lipopolysaccharide biosynthesis protein [Dyadobacter crusticola]|uniref:lipopolysaccharide biosynthesis protein n=1 Tax=Dyadobacter crusticola TaxID=292407 RepID=UPI0004E1EB33|nr:lipopolysaccharide biosynthesis protein [Dyadobacter crusticola]
MHIQGEIRRGTIAVFISKYSNILIGLGINSVLARLLSPGEYGILGIVTVFISFFYILSDIGIGVAIIQDQSLSQKDTSDIFKISVFLSLVLAVSFALLSSAIAWYYENEVYKPIGQLLAVSVFFSSLSVIPKSLLSKSRSFKLIGTIEVIVAVITGACAIYLASRGWSYYSIVWRSILSSTIIFFLHVYFSKLTIFKGFSLSGFRKIARYSFFQFAFNFINYFSRNLDNILIGKFMGNQSLGIYNQSYQLMMYPVSNLTHVITPVLHPVLAKFKDQPRIIFEEYLKVVNILAMLGVPVSILIFFSADEIIYILLGSKWMEVVPILRVFSITIWVQMITSSAGAIFQAVGRTDTLFKLGLFSAVTIVISIFSGVIYFKSLTATAISLSIAFGVNFITVFFILISNLLKENLAAFIQKIVSQLPLAFVLILLLSGAEKYITPHISSRSHIVLLAIKFSIVGVVFSIFHFKKFSGILKKFSKATS